MCCLLLRTPFAEAELLYSGNLVKLIRENLNGTSIHLWNSDSFVNFVSVSPHPAILVLRLLLSLPLMSGAELLILHNSDIG